MSGEYVVALPDGRIQTTRYEASPRLGYRAQVSYQGQARQEKQKENSREAQKEVPLDSSAPSVSDDEVLDVPNTDN